MVRDEEFAAALLRQVFTDEQIEELWQNTRSEFGALGAANSKLALAVTAVRGEPRIKRQTDRERAVAALGAINVIVREAW